VQTFRKRRAGLSATAGLSCFILHVTTVYFETARDSAKNLQDLCKIFSVKHFLLQTWLHVKQESRAIAWKSRDAVAVCFEFKFTYLYHK